MINEQKGNFPREHRILVWDKSVLALEFRHCEESEQDLLAGESIVKLESKSM